MELCFISLFLRSGPFLFKRSHLCLPVTLQSRGVGVSCFLQPCGSNGFAPKETVKRQHLPSQSLSLSLVICLPTYWVPSFPELFCLLQMIKCFLGFFPSLGYDALNIFKRFRAAKDASQPNPVFLHFPFQNCLCF